MSFDKSFEKFVDTTFWVDDKDLKLSTSTLGLPCRAIFSVDSQNNGKKITRAAKMAVNSKSMKTMGNEL